MPPVAAATGGGVCHRYFVIKNGRTDLIYLQSSPANHPAKTNYSGTLLHHAFREPVGASMRSGTHKEHDLALPETGPKPLAQRHRARGD